MQNYVSTAKKAPLVEALRSLNYGLSFLQLAPYCQRLLLSHFSVVRSYQRNKRRK